ncbi:hypothetical protein RJ639_046463 [Escallonia herrerae]|uniref:Uncharacterized protein n=1 Tax=Escallonia herrerae TaxID=1293975 RepID=A0AA89AZD8_9ASTE|nr:hypothetical protein RJ639_046463 [Escallonia herrerae]
MRKMKMKSVMKAWLGHTVTSAEESELRVNFASTVRRTSTGSKIQAQYIITKTEFTTVARHSRAEISDTGQRRQSLPNLPVGGRHFSAVISDQYDMWALAFAAKIAVGGTMNFLMLRSNQTAAPEQQAGVGFGNDVSKSAATLEGLIAQEPFPESSSADNHDRESDGFRSENRSAGGSSVMDNSPSVENHIDVSEDEGWIAIPYSTPLPLLHLFFAVYQVQMCSLHIAMVDRADIWH